MATFLSQFMMDQQLTSARVVSTTNLTANYYNGPTQNGVKATLTATSAAALVIDSVTVVIGNRVLVQGQTAPLENGLYVVSIAGDASNFWVLERSSDFQTIEQMKAGQYITIDAGTTRRGALYVLTEPLPGAVGVNDINFTESSTGVALGTAATKDATDNAVQDVASILPGPSVQNHFATFANVSRTLEDSGFTMTDDSEPLVASVISPVVAGHIPHFADTAGTIEDSGVLFSDPTEGIVASVDGATVIDHIASFDDALGTIKDSGIPATSIQLAANIHSTRTADIGGGGAGPITVAHTGSTVNSIVTATINASTNTVAIAKATAGVDQIDFLFTADPGASCLVNYNVFILSQ
jgi:hypothetical protein